MSQQINLFNPIFLKQKKIFTAVHMVQTLGVIAVGAVLLAVYGAIKTSQLEQAVNARKSAAAAAEARLAQVTKEFPPKQKSQALESDLARMQQELKSLHEVQGILERGELGNTAGYSEYFRALARQHVDGVWLTGLNVVGAGKEIGLEGRALQPELVPGYIQRLTREAVLQGKTFGSLEIARPGGGASAPASAPFVEFRLAAEPAQAKEGAK
ncbi:PilN domain-containing protein [Pseudoduganella sp. OTU4001]|uniref:PilN domain-containing protein n=1 Tax=Pseudoduganella sp. OTU4001 TaxID=3043854 RepID=UPI00313BE49C